MGRTRNIRRRVAKIWSGRDPSFELDAAARRRLETMDDWLLFGPRLR
jgi:hypothetical protein